MGRGCRGRNVLRRLLGLCYGKQSKGIFGENAALADHRVRGRRVSCRVPEILGVGELGVQMERRAQETDRDRLHEILRDRHVLDWAWESREAVLPFSEGHPQRRRTSWWLRWQIIHLHAEDPGLIPEPGKSPEEGNVNPLQYSCL